MLLRAAPGQSNQTTPFTQHNVNMLVKTPEYRLFQLVRRQGESFRFMWFWGMIGLFVLLYIDSVSFLLHRDSSQRDACFKGGYSPVGGLMCLVGPWVPPAMLLLALFLSGWVHTAAWASTYDAQLNIFFVALNHALASVGLCLIPLHFFRQTPFVLPATREEPWTPLIPFVSTFGVGLFFFFYRYRGHWKQKPLTTSPYFIHAPAQACVTLAVWTLLAYLADEWRRNPEAGIDAAARALVGKWLTTTRHDTASILAVMKALYCTFVLHGWLLAITTLVTTPLRYVPYLLSGRTVWIAAVAGVSSMTYILHSRDQLSTGPAAACTAILTALLVRGYEAD